MSSSSTRGRGGALYPSAQARAAHLLYFLIKDHPFADGNKRIGTLLFLEYLRRNGLIVRPDGTLRLDVSEEVRYGVEELAELLNREVGDPRDAVSRRTIRYFVQEGLLQEPYGGRGKHYGAEHLQRLRDIRELQKKGLSLSEVRDRLARPSRAAFAARAAGPAVPAPSSPWTRVELLPGVELHVSGRYRLPSAGELSELPEWCRRSLRRRGSEDPE
jgi:DNA-binding transcriptional MerR regulator